MKPSFLSRLTACLFFLFFAAICTAQDTTGNMTTLPGVTVTTSADVTKQVSRAFATSFKDADNPKWYKLSKNFLVEFIRNDMKNKALYQKNGKLIYHISYGNENNLPADIRKLIRNTYSDYDITTAINIIEANTNAWVVNLEGDKNLIVVKVADGALEEVYNFNKRK